MSSKYDDIMDLPHHVSPTRPHMSLHDRAAQFSPFAALTGYDAAIKETARLTDRQVQLDEDMLLQLNEQLQRLQHCIGAGSPVTVCYFAPDARKAGGAYVTVQGIPKKIDAQKRLLHFADGTTVPLDAIRSFADL